MCPAAVGRSQAGHVHGAPAPVPLWWGRPSSALRPVASPVLSCALHAKGSQSMSLDRGQPTTPHDKKSVMETGLLVSLESTPEMLSATGRTAVLSKVTANVKPHCWVWNRLFRGGGAVSMSAVPAEAAILLGLHKQLCLQPAPRNLPESLPWNWQSWSPWIGRSHLNYSKLRLFCEDKQIPRTGTALNWKLQICVHHNTSPLVSSV